MLPGEAGPVRLFLLRHAEAEAEALTDAERALTDLGREQAARVGEFCRRHHIRPDLVLSSPFRRALETARPVAEAIGAECVVEGFLASGMRPEDAHRELGAYRRAHGIMLVGHQPDLGWLAASLIGLTRSEGFSVPKASLTALEVSFFGPNGGKLKYTLPPQLMG